MSAHRMVHPVQDKFARFIDRMIRDRAQSFAQMVRQAIGVQ